MPWRPRRRWAAPRVWLEGGSLGEFVFALVFGLVVFPLLTFILLTGGEIVLLVVILPFVALARIAFGRHWWVEVRKGFSPYWEVQAGRWQQSGAYIRKIAGDIERGDLPLRSLGAPDEKSPTEPI